jgi:ketosteroid isomerase-like protein
MRIPSLAFLILAAFATAGAAADLEVSHQAVRNADLAMAKAVADGDAAGFRSWIGDAAVFLGGSSPRTGPDQIAAAWARFLDPEDPLSLAWEPTRDWLAASGELAATVGDYTLRYPGADGAPATETGRYLSVWSQGADGRWRIVADGTLSAEEPAPLQLSPEQLHDWLPDFAPGTELSIERRHQSSATAKSGDLAYTVGTTSVRAGSGDGVREGRGTVLTLWVFGDGGWIAVAEAATPLRPAD